MLAASLTVSAAVFACGGMHDSLPDPPPQDQCKPVAAPEPSQCPGTIGPPCPPCYSNGMKDYAAGDPLQLNDTEVGKVKDFEQWYLNWWGDNYPPQKEVEGPFLFLGSAGRGLIFLRKYLVEGKLNATLLDTAEAYLSISVEKLPREQSSGSYMTGHVGVWFLMSVVADLKGDGVTRDQYQDQITATFNVVNEALRNNASKSGKISLTDCTLDTGLSGMLYGGMLYNSYYPDMLPADWLASLAKRILDFGMETGAKLGTNYLQYESFANCYLWGPGHGSSGAIKTLFTAAKTYPDELSFILAKSSPYRAAIKNTLDFYTSIQLPDGNIPTNIAGGCAAHYGKDNDSRVQWCHGAPGFLNIFLEGSIIYSDSSYLEAGVKTATATWERGLLVKGTMFCHGIAGNVNMFQEASQYLTTLNSPLASTMAFRAKQFTLWTLDWGNINATRLTQSNEGYSMYQGNYAVPMLYTHVAQEGWPNRQPCQPGWNLCI